MQAFLPNFVQGSHFGPEDATHYLTRPFGLMESSFATKYRGGRTMLRSRNNGKNLLRETPTKSCLTNEPTPVKSILFVDDEPSILKVRKLVFENMGYCVLTAESGGEALKILCKNAVDVVVLDYMMPEMDGEETARRIRRLPGEIPIVLSSGCLSLPQRLLDLVNVSVDKTDGPEALRDAVEQQLHPAPVMWESSTHDAAVQLNSR